MVTGFGGWDESYVHSVFKAFWPLLQYLAQNLGVDRYWLDDSDSRNDPGYVLEAFQRLILDFILKNGEKTFMKCKVKQEPGRLERWDEAFVHMLGAYWLDMRFGTSTLDEKKKLACRRQSRHKLRNMYYSHARLNARSLYMDLKAN